MLKQIEEYGKFIEISGFHNVEIKDTPQFLSKLNGDLPEKVEVQLFNSDLVASWQHLYFAVLNALMAHKTKRNISKSLAVETVLYASSQRQIKKAIEVIGVKPASKDIALVIIGEDPKSVKNGLTAIVEHIGSQPDEDVLDVSDEKIQLIKKAFNLSDKEIEIVTAHRLGKQAIVDIVVERVALLSTQL